jgi:hypothetical protein
VAATSAGEKHRSGELRPKLDRLTVGVDLGDQGSHYCILGLEGETLAEGQLRTTQEDLATFFQGLNAARVVVEVGTHSAWVQEVISGCGHEVLVGTGANRNKSGPPLADPLLISICRYQCVHNILGKKR